MMSEVESLEIRPYARLLTMLGEQLIKNDRIALVELVKNSYDADATEVVVSLDAFGPGLQKTADSTLSLTDNGDGMSYEVVKNAWLNPATSSKVKRKHDQPTTRGGRIIQGEKGIGRFAIFKLGARATVITRGRDEISEIVAEYDIRFLDNDDIETLPLGQENLSADDTYLDELRVAVLTREPQVFDGSNPDGLNSTNGTRIEVRSLRSKWSSSLLDSCHQDLLRLQPLTGLLTGHAGNDGALNFAVTFLVDGNEPEGLVDSDALLSTVVERAVLRVVGSFDAARGIFSLTVNDSDRVVDLNSPEMRGLRLYRQHFGVQTDAVSVACGDYEFEFLIFDLRSSAEAKHRLDPDQKALVKSHRIYLYRDGLRVLPYGDPDDDWLQLDVIRGTQGASRVLSNDQTLGFIYISQAMNPDLRDKTNREGLIDSGQAYSDFRATLQLLITHLRRGDFSRHLTVGNRREAAAAQRVAAEIPSSLQNLRDSIQDPRVKDSVDSIVRAYDIQNRFMTERVQRTEDLAGVGISVETASHDIVSAAGHALRDARLLQTEIQFEVGVDGTIYARSTTIVDSLSFIVSRLQDVQGLFVSSRQRARVLDVVQYARKIQAIYQRLLRQQDIEVTYAGDTKLEVKTVDATLLQIFLNLMDNSIYWLTTRTQHERRIEIRADNDQAAVIFSDNGPGVAAEDAPYIFDAFYSGKGDEGRGLGLYIAREVARRSGFELDLLLPDESVLGGASFRLRMKVEAE